MARYTLILNCHQGLTVIVLSSYMRHVCRHALVWGRHICLRAMDNIRFSGSRTCGRSCGWRSPRLAARALRSPMNVPALSGS